MKLPIPLQAYLRHWKSTEKLTEEFGINVIQHPSLPLIACKYDQINSPKSHPITLCSRGTVLHRDTYDLVAMPFTRFFNYCENMIEQKQFNWNDFYCNEKLDGSLVILYHFDNDWHVNTSGSFAFGPMVEFGDLLSFSWRELIFKTFNKYEGFSFFKLNTKFTYILELTSPFNKVVRTYKEPELTLLGVYNIEYDPYELSQCNVDSVAIEIGLPRPQTYHFKSETEVTEFIKDREANDPSYEGIVIQDNTGLRFKVKSSTYLSLAHIKDNGNIANPKRMVNFLLKNSADELIGYFSELKDIVNQTQEMLDKEYNNLKDVWVANYQIKDQKEFALAIQGKTKFTGVLFTIRKLHGNAQTEQELREMWRNYGEGIVKTLFK